MTAKDKDEEESLIEQPAEIHANGYIDHKVNFNENLSEAVSNSWEDEASISYGEEAELEIPVVLPSEEYGEELDQDSPRKILTEDEV